MPKLVPFDEGAPPDWVLTETVEGTVVYVNMEDEDYRLDILFERTTERGAVVLSFNENGQVLVNGLFLDLGEDMMSYCSLADEIVGIGAVSADNAPKVGVKVTSHPFEDESEEPPYTDPDDEEPITVYEYSQRGPEFDNPLHPREQ